MKCQTVRSEHYFDPRGRKKKQVRKWCILFASFTRFCCNSFPYRAIWWPVNFRTCFFSSTWCQIMFWSYSLTLYGLEKMDYCALFSVISVFEFWYWFSIFFEFPRFSLVKPHIGKKHWFWPDFRANYSPLYEVFFDDLGTYWLLFFLENTKKK